MKNKLLCLLSFFPFFLSSMEYKPWTGGEFERYLQLEGNAFYTWGHFHGVEAKGKGEALASSGSLNGLGLDLNFPVLEAVFLEATCFFKDSYYHSFYFDSFECMAKVPLCSDIQGNDPYAFSLGAIYKQNGAVSLLDLTSFHHSLAEGEFFFSVGKEVPFKRTYFFRTFFKAGYAICSRGNSYANGLLHTEWNFCDTYRFFASLDYLQGLGSKNLYKDQAFKGYKSIHHQNLDMTIGGKYTLRNGSLLALHLLKRLYVKNAPSSYTEISLNYTYPFSI